MAHFSEDRLSLDSYSPGAAPTQPVTPAGLAGKMPAISGLSLRFARHRYIERRDVALFRRNIRKSFRAAIRWLAARRDNADPMSERADDFGTREAAKSASCKKRALRLVRLSASSVNGNEV
jgi:hypothetical protein